MQIGTPVLHSDMANHRAGWIAEIKDGSPNKSYVIGANGMQPAGREIVVVWENNSYSQLPEAIAANFVSKAETCRIEPVDNAETLLEQAKIKQEKDRQARKQQQEEKETSNEAWRDKHREKVPTWAKAVLVAEYHRDDCDTMTDYFNTIQERTVILAFSKHTRDLFPEMRKAALNHPETAHMHDLPKENEFRQKYAMGGGYYLGEAGAYRTGWRVCKIRLDGSYRYSNDPMHGIPVGEWSVPDATQKPISQPKPSSNATEWKIEEHTHTKKGYQMFICCMTDRVERDEYQRLLADARALGGWYSRKWGTSPAGFAFKSEESASEFVANSSGGASPDDGGPTDGTTRPTTNPAEKLRGLAEGMQGAIDSKFAERRTNTPKRAREAQSAWNDGYHLKRTQAALLALSDAWEAGTVPDVLAGTKSKTAVHELTRTIIERSGNYYDAGTDTGKPAVTTPEAIALWDLMGNAGNHDQSAEALKQKLIDLKQSKIPGYFPTPGAVVERMLELVEVTPSTILEPSAGSGSLWMQAKEAYPDATIDCCEINRSLQEVLEMLGADVIADDFNELASEKRYDLVFMNPPFEGGQDMAHVRKAFEHLAPGGQVVAVMSPHFTFASNSKAEAFRQWLKGLVWDIHELPENSFKESGTGVAANIVSIRKEESL